MKTDKIENYADLLRAKADVIDSIRYNVKDCNENIESITKELEESKDIDALSWKRDRLHNYQNKLEVWNNILEYLIK